MTRGKRAFEDDLTRRWGQRRVSEARAYHTLLNETELGSYDQLRKVGVQAAHERLVEANEAQGLIHGPVKYSVLRLLAREARSGRSGSIDVSALLAGGGEIESSPSLQGEARFGYGIEPTTMAGRASEPEDLIDVNKPDLDGGGMTRPGPAAVDVPQTLNGGGMTPPGPAPHAPSNLDGTGMTRPRGTEDDAGRGRR